MTKKLNSGRVGHGATFATAVGAATARINDLSARLATLATVSGNAALQMSKLSASAAQMVALCQGATTHCQCNCKIPPNASSDSLWFLDQMGRVFIPAASILATVRLSAQGMKWLWTTGKAIAMSGPAMIGRAVVLIWEAVVASEAFAAVAGAADALIASVVAVVTSPAFVLIAEIAAAAALLAGVVYLAWRNWSAIVRAIGRAASAVSREVIAIVNRLASAVRAEPDDSFEEDLGLGSYTPHRRRVPGRRYSIASSLLDSVSASLRGVSSLASVAWKQPELWSGFQTGHLILRKAAAIAMLAVPLLAAPALAAIPSGQRAADTACAPSIVINSAPTIVINSSQSADIEHLVLDALTQHREAIYEQWHRELQRRQRTEF